MRKTEMRMTGARKLVLTALTAAILTCGFHGAAQAGRITASLPGYSTPVASIRLAASVCGGNGCYVVQTKQNPKHTKFKPLGHG